MDTFDYPTLSTKNNTNNPTLNKLATIIDINNGVINFKYPVNFNSSTNLTLPTPVPTTMNPTTNPTMDYNTNYMNTTMNPTTNPIMDYNTNYMNTTMGLTTNPTMDYNTNYMNTTTMSPTTNVNLSNEINNNVLNGLFNY
jgi:hypothetical protein